MSLSPVQALATQRVDRSGGLVSNRVLLLLWCAAAGAAFGLAFITVAPNRLVSGVGFALPALPPQATSVLVVPAAFWLLASFMAPRRLTHSLTMLAAVWLFTGLVWLAGGEATRQSAELSNIARVSLGGGFWALVMLSWLAGNDALRRLRLALLWRTLAQAAMLLPSLALLMLGHLDQLALLKEYANRQDVFQAAWWRHLQIVLATLVPSLLIGVPLGLAAARSARLARPLFAVLNVIQTVPSIALFGLLIAPLVWLGQALPGSGIHGIGLLPAVIALTLYSLLPIVHGMSSGLRQVPPNAVDAATGMGMTPQQILWRVELPLALPVLLSGLRVTTVQMIGLAVVAALIGAGGFGAIVFQGLLSSALDLVLLGVLPVVVLAMAVDALFKVITAALPASKQVQAHVQDHAQLQVQVQGQAQAR